jgi:hypothetical protein
MVLSSSRSLPRSAFAVDIGKVMEESPRVLRPLASLLKNPINDSYIPYRRRAVLFSRAGSSAGKELTEDV